MNDVLETIKYRGYTMEWAYDENVEDPCEWFVSDLICFHHRYSIGKSHNYSDDLDFLQDLVLNNVDTETIFLYMLANDYIILEREDKEISHKKLVKEHIDELGIKSCLTLLENYVVIDIISIYDHSGVKVDLGYNVGWDWSNVGYAYITKKKALELIDTDENNWQSRARKTLENEIRTYSEYVEGSVYKYTLYDPEGNEVDACAEIYESEKSAYEKETRQYVDSIVNKHLALQPEIWTVE